MKAKHAFRREPDSKIAPDAGQQAKNAPEPLGETEIAALAYRLWQERGCPDGCPEEDWFRAERELAEAGKRDH